MSDLFDYEWKAVVESTKSQFGIIEWHANEIIKLQRKIIEQLDFLERKIQSSKESANDE